MNSQVKYLLTLPQHPQRSKEWYQARENKITASIGATFLFKDDKTCDPYIAEFNIQKFIKDPSSCCNPYADRDQYIHEKVTGISSFQGNVATYWGQKYEPIATQLYSMRTGKEVLEFGLIPHKYIDWLAASPDGITPEGRMLEIKCPYRRKITGIPPFYYWIQVQLQLEVCDLDVCDFLECEFIEYCSVGEFLDDSLEKGSIESKGIFLQIETIPDDPAKKTYVYPGGDIQSEDEYLEWEKKERMNCKLKLNQIVKPVYWKLVVYSCVPIRRNKEWFKAIRDDLELTSKEIKMKKDQLVHRRNKFTTSYQDTCLLDEDDE